MNSIDKLAIEREAFECYQFEQGFIHQSTYDKDENGIYLNIRMRDDWKLWQASAKALQQSSEPVAEGKSHRWDDVGERCLDCGDKDWFADKYCTPTHPPASVSLEKYNKLIETLIRAKTRFSLLAAHDDTIRNGVIPSVGADDIEQAIAEAEGKEG